MFTQAKYRGIRVHLGSHFPAVVSDFVSGPFKWNLERIVHRKQNLYRELDRILCL
jgi:hypothetical protein